MNLYILKQKEFEGLGFGYVLISEQGEGLASCFCKTESRASVKRAMMKQCPIEIRKQWKDRFGKYKILFLGDDETTREELEQKNIEFYGIQDTPVAIKEDDRFSDTDCDFDTITSHMNIMGSRGW
jgi:hypothetical protein